MSHFPDCQVSFVYESKNKKVFSLDAELYQDILRYCLSDEIQNRPEFRLNDLAKWLMKNNSYFVRYYSGYKARTSMTRRIASRRRKIEECVDRLVSQDMIEIKAKVPGARNKSDLTPLYNFNLKANFYALFNRLHNAEQRTIDDAARRILELIHDALAKSDLAAAIFFSKVLEELRTRATAEDIFSLAILIAPIWTTNVKLPFLDIFMFLAKARVAEVEPYRTAFPNAFHKLDREARKLFLLQFKLDIEHQYLLIFSDRKWERERLDNFVNIDKALFPLFCKSCDTKFYRQIKLAVFLGLSQPAQADNNRKETTKRNLLKCPKCGSDDTYLPPIGANKSLDNKLIVG